MFEPSRRIAHRNFGQDKAYYRAVYTLFGFTPDNIELYKLALIHRSASLHHEGKAINNERLEFLGDAILESVVSDFLYIEFPDESEGFLTQMRSKIVSRQSLDLLARLIGLDHYVVANAPGNQFQKHLYGNALEAIIGAIYLDKGYDFANRFIINDILKQHIDLGDMSHTENDFKSRLIEWCQKSKRNIQFRTSHAPDSNSAMPRFNATIIIDGIEMGHGEGSSKKEAEQTAAHSVLQVINDDISDYFMEKIDTIEQNRQNE